MSERTEPAERALEIAWHESAGEDARPSVPGMYWDVVRERWLPLPYDPTAGAAEGLMQIIPHEGVDE